jgi:hypothetical protein
MQRRGDSELGISMWSSEWLDGRGVAHMAGRYIDGGWRPTEIHDANDEAVDADFDMIRTSGATHLRPASEDAASAVPVICELSKLRHERGSKRQSGPLDERIVEFAVSVVPCRLGLHAVDIRRPVSEVVFAEPRKNHAESIAREVLDEFRGVYRTMPLAWAVCYTFGRGPSLAELYCKHESTIIPGAVYLSKVAPVGEVASALRPARVVDVEGGYEIALTTLFGGPVETASAAMYDGLWKFLRKCALTGLPWDTLSSLRR